MKIISTIIKIICFIGAIITIIVNVSPKIKTWFESRSTITLNPEQTNILLIIIIIILLLSFLLDMILKKVKQRKEARIRVYFEKYVSNQRSFYLDKFKDKNTIIKRMRKSISNLIKKGKTSTLNSDVYYLYLFSLLNGARKRIWATSILGEGEWNDSVEEKEFLRLNLEAQLRKVLVERVFIIERSSFTKLNILPVLEQIRLRNDYLKTYIIFKEDITKSKPNLLTDIGSGFLAFDDYAIAIDVFEDSEIRGMLSLDDETIDRYNRIFTNLRDFLKPLDTALLSSSVSK
jgi:hypothetical protein